MPASNFVSFFMQPLGKYLHWVSHSIEMVQMVIMATAFGGNAVHNFFVSAAVSFRVTWGKFKTKRKNNLVFSLLSWYYKTN